jgi:hypothetical protein
MRLLPIVACIAAGSNASYAEAGASDSPNPKTSLRRYVGRGADVDTGIKGERDSSARGKQALLLQQKLAARALLPTSTRPGSTALPGSPQGLPLGLPLIGGDDCNAPAVISGTGIFSFDDSTATTGTQGQNEALCVSPGIDADVWFRWTAPASGTATFALCGNGSWMDSKIAAYPGASCPLDGSALACNDDACGLYSRVTFAVTNGASYMLQLGAYPGSAGDTGIFTLGIVPGAPNDQCSAATPISGSGTFPFDTAAATTSPQQGLACGSGTCYSDVWFDWTAPANGLCNWSLCGGASFDTLIAVYAGAGCPSAGTSIACNDDSCGPQSSVSFPCAGGNHYMLQLGAYSTGTGNGSFSISVTPPPANDDCSTPQALGSMLGTVPFSLLGASTGAQGQLESACSFQGQTGIASDVWFSWTAPASARARLSLCAGSSFDSKVALYAGSGCPAPGSAMTCNDDACNLTSELCFDVLAGHAYTIQLGTYPGSAQASGSFDLALTASLPPCTCDDGTSENLLGLGTGGDMVWLQRFGSAGSTSVVSSIDVAWGSPAHPGLSPGNGTPTDVFLWQDGATQDGDPSDATLLWSSAASVSGVDTDTFTAFAFAPITIQGIFFVGSHLAHVPGQSVAPMDQNCPSTRVSWFFGAGPGQSVNYANPGANPFPPENFDQAGFPANLMLRGGCSSDPASYLCDPGSGGVQACPCANPPSGPGRGCDNSSGTGGASMHAAGASSLGTPSLSFTTADERPSATSILLQGTAGVPAGLGLGQGVRCIGGVLKRLYVKTAVAGSISAPNLAGGDADIATRSAALGDPISAGQERWYMVYYRDPNVLGGCSALFTYNGSTSARVTWRP